MNYHNSSILVVDDEADICNMVSEILNDNGYNVKTAFSKDNAIKTIEETGITLVITDIWMNDNDHAGIELLEWCKNHNSLIPVIIMSGHGSIETAMTAAKNGAYDFVEKPFNSSRLLLLVEKALNERFLKIKLMDSENEWVKSNHLLGQSSPIKNIKNVLSKVFLNNSRVLISGPAGSGKETCARFLHMNSNRLNQPFVTASCATLSAQMVDQLLFGWSEDSDSYSGSGLFEQANYGTLFFDEICDLPLETQGKLVNTIQDQSFYKYKNNKKINLDVRIVSASNYDLKKSIENGILREDLYYRLSVIPISMPSLSERNDDIPILIDHFMNVASKLLNKYPLVLSNDTLALLQTYDWPGNVRQLKNVIEWLLIMHGNKEDFTIKINDLPPEISKEHSDNNRNVSNNLNLPLKDARKLFEKDYIESQLLRFKGNIARTSNFIGMDRSALHRKIKELGIEINND